ncbi:MAG: lytic transglycosylase domain-containing protein [bacterium]|nr:lytic transglycosylase domain-containing protein [bacterium]
MDSEWVIVRTEGDEYFVPLRFIIGRTSLDLVNDKDQIESIAEMLIEGVRVFEDLCRSYIEDNRWDALLYQRIEVQDPNHPKATLDAGNLGTHSSVIASDGRQIEIQLDHILNGKRAEVLGTIVHEMLHHYIEAASGIRNLDEAVTEYVSRYCAGLPHHNCNGSYQSMVDALKVLVEERLSFGPDSLLSLALKKDGLQSEIDSRFILNGNAEKVSEVLAQLYQKEMPEITPPASAKILNYFGSGEISYGVDCLLGYLHDLEKTYQVKPTKAIDIVQKCILLLERRDDLTPTEVHVRPPRKIQKGFSDIKKLISNFFISSTPYLLRVKELIWPVVLIIWGKGKERFKQVPRKVQTVTVVLLVVIICFSSYLILRRWFYPDTVQLTVKESSSLGVNRYRMSPEQLNDRRQKFYRSTGRFLLLRRPEASGVDKKLDQYRLIIEKAARDVGVDPYWLMGIAIQESYLRANAVNADTKATGMFQFLKSTASLKGLIQSRRDYRLIIDGIDYRSDPEKSAFATAELFRQAIKRWGDPAFAAWDHHAGTDIPSQAARIYLDETHPGWTKHGSVFSAVKALKITYWDLFLRPSYAYAPKTFGFMQSLHIKDHDFSDEYAARVETARWLAESYFNGDKTELVGYLNLYADLRKSFKFESGFPSAAWWGFYPATLIRTKDCDDLRKMVVDKILVPLPDNSKKTGFTVVSDIGYVKPEFLSEGSEISHNEKHRGWYQSSRPETVGMALYLSGLYQEALASKGKGYKPLRITSISRTEWFQEKLREMKQASPTKQLPLHLAGWAIDVGKLGMDDESQAIMMFIISEMTNSGMISYSDEENPPHWHLVPAPAYRDFFVSKYYEFMSN